MELIHLRDQKRNETDEFPPHDPGTRTIGGRAQDG
jgi:hypothetical protein